MTTTYPRCARLPRFPAHTLYRPYRINVYCTLYCGVSGGLCVCVCVVYTSVLYTVTTQRVRLRPRSCVYCVCGARRACICVYVCDKWTSCSTAVVRPHKCTTFYSRVKNCDRPTPRPVVSNLPSLSLSPPRFSWYFRRSLSASRTLQQQRHRERSISRQVFLPDRFVCTRLHCFSLIFEIFVPRAFATRKSPTISRCRFTRAPARFALVVRDLRHHDEHI